MQGAPASACQQQNQECAMPEYEGFQIVYEVLAMPKGKWAIMIEIIRREDGEVLMARHNPFPRQPFDTRLEALDNVKQYVADTIGQLPPSSCMSRIA
jgi:hypothetical protein